MHSAFLMNEDQGRRHLSRPRPSHSCRRAKRASAWQWRLGLLILGGIALLPIYSKKRQAEPTAPAEATAPLPAWVELAGPQTVFQFEGPQFPRAAGIHMARRHRLGGGRQDSWQFTSSDQHSALLDLLIYQPGSEVVTGTSFYVDLARRAAESGRAILKAEQPAALATKFGPFEVAHIDLDRNGAANRQCLGFRYKNAAPGLRILGFACAENHSAVLAMKAWLACLIDGINLDPAAADKMLIDFFAAHYALPNPSCIEGDLRADRD